MEPTPKSELKDGKVYLCWNTQDYVRISHNTSGNNIAYWAKRNGDDYFFGDPYKKRLGNEHMFYEVGSEYELLFYSKKRVEDYLHKLRLIPENSAILNEILTRLENNANGV